MTPFLFIFVFTLYICSTSATLTFRFRHIPTQNAVRKPVQPPSATILPPSTESACSGVRAAELAKSPLPHGSYAMLNAANKHARSMAAKGRLFQPPIREINSRRAFPCGTFLSGVSVGRSRTAASDVGATCARLWRPKKGARSLTVVIGSHRSRDGIVWCVALFGARTKFQPSGACARVTCRAGH